jgi:hypothetical protein
MSLAFSTTAFGNLSNTVASLWNQQRWMRVVGQSFAAAAWNPIAHHRSQVQVAVSTPRARRSRSSSFKDWLLSRIPSLMANSSFFPDISFQIQFVIHMDN